MSSLRRLSHGLLAGLTGSAAMHGFRFFWEGVTHHCSEDAIYGFDDEADINAARLLTSSVRVSLPERQAARLGIGLHYIYGAALGALYAATRRRNRLGKAQVISFGLSLWLCTDEIPVALTGVSDPFRKSIASHGGALLAHLVFATAVETVLSAVPKRSGPLIFEGE